MNRSMYDEDGIDGPFNRAMARVPRSYPCSTCDTGSSPYLAAPCADCIDRQQANWVRDILGASPPVARASSSAQDPSTSASAPPDPEPPSSSSPTSGTPDQEPESSSASELESPT